MSASASDAKGVDQVRVAVVDSGRDPLWRHRRILPGLDATTGSAPADPALAEDDHDRNGHGTACAELILRWAPAAEILPVRVFGESLETTVATLVRGIDRARERQARIIHLSLGTRLATAIVPLYAACERARRAGIVVIAAAHPGPGASFPATFDNTLGVVCGGAAGPAVLCAPDRAVECVARAPRRVRGLRGFQPAAPTSSFAAPRVTARVAGLLAARPTAALSVVRALLADPAQRPCRASHAR